MRLSNVEHAKKFVSVEPADTRRPQDGHYSVNIENASFELNTQGLARLLHCIEAIKKPGCALCESKGDPIVVAWWDPETLKDWHVAVSDKSGWGAGAVMNEEMIDRLAWCLRRLRRQALAGDKKAGKRAGKK